jgi:transglutaminase superfamily protein
MALDLQQLNAEEELRIKRADGLGAEPEPEDEHDDAPPAVPLEQTALAAALATAAAVWMVGGIFDGLAPRIVGLAAAAIGSALGYSVYRFRKPWLQYVVPVAGLLFGAALVAPDARTGTSSLPALVLDAVRTGGFLQPPVDFAPGWKLIFTVVFVMLAAGAVGVAVATSRPRLAAAVPMPLALGAALVQPQNAALLSSAVTIVAALAAFAVAYGADLGRGIGRDRALGAGFETRRLARTGAMVAGLVAAVVLLNQAGFLFPSPDQNRVVPPQRPQVPPQVPDVPLFKVTTNAQTPFRLGVIDVYDVKQGAWMLPEQDNRRLRRDSAPVTVPGPKLGAQFLSATFVVEQATGHLLPSIGGTVKIEGLSGQQFDYDPRQGTISLAGRPVFSGLTYTVEAALPAGGADLRKADPPPPSIRNQFLAAPPVPLEVQELLAKAPTSNLFDRLQYVRAQLYSKATAAGPGKPVDVSARRAVQILGGADANPYEITATEALLARWAGIPARIGYGYNGGTPLPGGALEVRPRNGATWLEAYFGQYGWIPIVGTPPRARPSTSTQTKNQNPAVHATDDLALIVYLPVRVHTLLPIYVIARYWLLVALPFVVAAVLLVVFYPALVKLLRSRRRKRWALRQAPEARIAVAYAEFRDVARDLAVGDPMATPLEFLDYIEPDKEHRELAWLVTRSLYGDIRGEQLTPEHAQVAEEFAASVRRRVFRAQSLTTKLLSLTARTSLRDPYSAEVPNLWWPAERRRMLPLPARATAAAAAVIGVALTLTSCGSTAPLKAGPLPARLVPTALGTLTFAEEAKAEASYLKARRNADIMVSEGRVFTLHYGDVVEGSIQVSRFKPGYSASDPEVVDAIKASIGNFYDFHRAAVPVWLDRTPDQRIYLWFAPHSDSMTLLVLRASFTPANADAVARALAAYEAGRDLPPDFNLGPDQQGGSVQ